MTTVITDTNYAHANVLPGFGEVAVWTHDRLKDKGLYIFLPPAEARALAHQLIIEADKAEQEGAV